MPPLHTHTPAMTHGFLRQPYSATQCQGQVRLGIFAWPNSWFRLVRWKKYDEGSLSLQSTEQLLCLIPHDGILCPICRGGSGDEMQGLKQAEHVL